MCAASDLVRISLAALSALVLTGAAGAQVTSLGGFSPSTIGPISTGTGSGSASGGTGGGLITLRAQCSAEDTPEGTCKITRRTVGSVSVGPLGAQLEIESQLLGTLEIEEQNGGQDRATVLATVSVAGVGVTNSHSFAKFSPGTQGVSDLQGPVICLAPGVHALTIELTTEAVISPDTFLFPTDVNSSKFDGAGFKVTFTEVSGVAYCTAGTSASGCQGLISATGLPSTSALSGFELEASGLPGGKEGIFFFGTSGRQANPWGSGTSYQCVVPPVSRTSLILGTGTTGLCDGLSKFDLNAYWCPSCPKPAKNPGGGAIVQAQFWYRDPFNTSNQTTSLSDAFEFCVGP